VKVTGAVNTVAGPGRGGPATGDCDCDATDLPRVSTNSKNRLSRCEALAGDGISSSNQGTRWLKGFRAPVGLTNSWVISWGLKPDTCSKSIGLASCRSRCTGQLKLPGGAE